MINILSGSINSETKDAWRSAAHRFKGASGNLGAMKLHHLCKRAESHFEDDESGKKEMLNAILNEMHRVENFFQNNHIY